LIEIDDAEGNRVRKTTGGLSVDYVYDLAGQAMAEMNATGGWNRAEVYAGGRHVATYASSTTYFALGDWLGTERVRTTVAGAKCETVTSLAFGDGQVVTGSCGDPSPMHFTGKQRDTESGLDNFGARYNSSAFGRFMSPDSTAYVKPVKPQTWNLYAYARNNPILYTNPSGNTVVLTNCEDKAKCAAVLAEAAQLPPGVTAGVDKNGNLTLSGDTSKIKGGNALRLLQLVNSQKTANFWIGDKAPGLDKGQTQDIKGGLSGTKSQGYDQNFSVVQSDPSKVDSHDLGGVFLQSDGSTPAGRIPGSDIAEAAAHELLGHVWADLVGGVAAGTEGNLKEALIAEDRVRNTDPSRGLKVRHQDSDQLITPADLPRITNPGNQP
jgi:RHS repeat-associated protein